MWIIACIAGTIFFAAKDLSSKYLAFRVSGLTSAFASFTYSLPYYFVALGIAWLLGYESFAFGGNFLLLVVLRSITDSCAEWLKMEALGRGEISLLMSFLYLSPVFVLFLSPLLLDDQLSTQGVIGVLIVASGGLLLLVREGMGTLRGSLKGIVLALLSAFFFSLNHCLDRLAVQHSSALFSGFSMTVLSALMFYPLVRRGARAKEVSREWRMFTLRGFLELASMFCKLYALQHFEAAYVVAILRASLVFSVIGGAVIYKERDFLARFAAGLLTVIGSLVILLQ